MLDELRGGVCGICRLDVEGRAMSDECVECLCVGESHVRLERLKILFGVNR